MVNLVINLIRVVYIIVGIILLLVGLLSPVAGADSNTSSLVVLAMFIFYAALGVLFIWLSNILKKRSAYAIRYVIALHISLFLIFILTFVGMLFNSQSYIHKEPTFYIFPFVFWCLVSLLPLYFFSRSKVREQFK